MKKRIPYIILSILQAMFLGGTLLHAENSPSPISDTEGVFRAAHQSFLRLATGEGKDIQLRYLYEPDHNLENTEGANLTLSEFLIEGEVPILLNRDLFLRIRTFASARKYDLHRVAILGQPIEAETLYKTQAGVGVGYFTSDALLLTAMITPGLFSNFDSTLNSSQVAVYGELLGVYAFTTQFQFISGVVSDEVFESVRVYPVVALRYRTQDERWQLKLTPPVSARVGYSLSPELQIYTNFNITGDRYRVHLSEAATDFNLQVQDKRLGIGALYFLDTHWNLSAELGASLKSRFKFKLSDDQSLPGESTSSTAYAFLSLGYAL